MVCIAPHAFPALKGINNNCLMVYNIDFIIMKELRKRRSFLNATFFYLFFPKAAFTRFEIPSAIFEIARSPSFPDFSAASRA